MSSWIRLHCSLCMSLIQSKEPSHRSHLLVNHFNVCLFSNIKQMQTPRSTNSTANTLRFYISTVHIRRMCDHAQDGHSGWSSVLNRKPVGKTPPLSYTHSHKLIHFAGGARVKNSECKSVQIRLVVCGSMRWVIITLMQQPAKKRLRRWEEYTHCDAVHQSDVTPAVTAPQGPPSQETQSRGEPASRGPTRNVFVERLTLEIFFP